MAGWGQKLRSQGRALLQHNPALHFRRDRAVHVFAESLREALT